MIEDRCDTSSLDTSPPTFLYKILSVSDWSLTRERCEKLFLPSSDDAFIHLAREEQVAKIFAKFYRDDPSQYVVLKLETKLLVGQLRLESNPGGQNLYYHLYGGCIPYKAVVEVQPPRL